MCAKNGDGNSKDEDRFDLFCSPAFSRIEQALGRIFIAVEGNGEIGLKGEVLILKEKVASLEKWRAWLIGANTALAIAVLTQLIVSVINK